MNFSNSALDSYVLDDVFADVSNQPSSTQRSALHRHPVLGLISYLCLLLIFILTTSLMWLKILCVPSIVNEIRILVSFHLFGFVSTTSLYRYLYIYQRQELFQGYLRFYHRINRILPLPFYTVSAASCCILVTIFYSEHATVLLFLRITLLMEHALAFCLVLWYNFLSMSHSISNSRPDAYKELSSALRHPIPELSSGYRGDDASLLERQSTLLRFQNAQLRRLSMEIIKMKQSLVYDQGRDGYGWRRVSSDDRMANEEEMNALHAEIAKLEEESRSSRSLISEQKVEIEEMKNWNQKYSDENERLRLSLEEWSSFNARLQIALDTEQKRNNNNNNIINNNNNNSINNNNNSNNNNNNNAELSRHDTFDT